MSRQNSIRKQLLEDVTSIKKMLVECEINGWLETSKKQQPQKNRVLYRQKVKHKSIQNMPVDKLETINDEIEREVSFKRLHFQQKPIAQTTQGTRQVKRITLFEHRGGDQNCENSFGSVAEIMGKPLKSGYILKELRKRGKQRSHLKKFSNGLTKSACFEGIKAKASKQYFEREYKRLQVLSSRQTGQ